MEQVTNPFSDSASAQRYQTYRPQYHGIPFSKVRSYVQKKIPRSLDVACGTGHSTVALSKISEEVIGCDLSSAMLAEARKHSNIAYLESAAENLPFPDRSFDLINISMGIHWVNQPAFLKEAGRVLKHDGYFSIDNYGFSGVMFDRADFNEAHKKFYQLNLPTAARHQNYPTADLLTQNNFELQSDFPYEQSVRMNLDEFANFVMTQSNFLGLPPERQEIVSQALMTDYAPFFGSAQDLKFVGLLKLYKLTKTTSSK